MAAVQGSFHHFHNIRKSHLRNKRANKRAVEEVRALVVFDRRCPPERTYGCSRAVFGDILDVLYPGEPVDGEGVNVAFAHARSLALAATTPAPEAAVDALAVAESAPEPESPPRPSTGDADLAPRRPQEAVAVVVDAATTEQLIPRAHFAACVQRYLKYAALAPQIAALWRTCDANGSGLLEHDELRRALNELERGNFRVREQRCKSGALLQRCDDETAAYLVRACDSDGDGALDKNDFMQAMLLWRRLAKDRDRRQQREASAACAVM
jgi:Ca2+-binding EF-hand superfamily protein